MDSWDFLGFQVKVDGFGNLPDIVEEVEVRSKTSHFHFCVL